MESPGILKKSSNTDKIQGYLAALGLTTDQSELYIYLHILGPSTVLALSKALCTGRTRLYPILESLETQGLIVIHEKHYGTTYEVLPSQSLEFLVHERETKAQQLRGELSDIQSSLAVLSGEVTKGSRVIEYKGVEGLKHINFNLSKAVKEFRVFEVAHLDEYPVLPKAFVDRMRRAYFDNKITTYDLTNNPNRKSVSIPQDPDCKYQNACYVDPDVFTIEVETYIYNDCIAYLQYDEDNIFGVEIYNQALANQQKNLYDLVWAQGTELLKT